MWVQSLDWEDPLEKDMATHFTILAWRIPWTEKPGGLQSIKSQRVLCCFAVADSTLETCSMGPQLSLSANVPQKPSAMK